jgi:hypothetical protein
MPENNPITRVIPDFENELKAIDPRLSIVPNPNRPLIANIKIDGVDVCPIPRYEIREHPDVGYTAEMPNGSVVKHRSKEEAINLVRHTLQVIETQDGADAFFGRNGY